MFVTRTWYGLTTKQDFMKKYLTKIYSKNLENHGFVVYHPSNNGHVTDPIADKVSKIVLKVQENFGNTYKKSY